MKKNSQRTVIMKNKIKIYCFTCLILTFILTLLRCISLTAFYDTRTGYFNSAFIPTVMNMIYILSSVWCLSTLILIPHSHIETDFTPSFMWMKGASMFSTVLFICSAIFMLVSPTESKFHFINVLTVALSALFFILTIVKNDKSDNIRAFISMALIAALTVILATLYFDMTIAMNSPHKIHGSFVLMSAMIFGLCETRTYLGTPIPRVHLASALLTFMLGISFTLSAIIYLFTAQPTEFVSNPVILGNVGYIGVIMGISVYAISRCFAFESKEITQTEKTEESNGLYSL